MLGVLLLLQPCLNTTAVVQGLLGPEEGHRLGNALECWEQRKVLGVYLDSREGAGQSIAAMQSIQKHSGRLGNFALHAMLNIAARYNVVCPPSLVDSDLRGTSHLRGNL